MHLKKMKCTHSNSAINNLINMQTCILIIFYIAMANLSTMTLHTFFVLLNLYSDEN